MRLGPDQSSRTKLAEDLAAQISKSMRGSEAHQQPVHGRVHQQPGPSPAESAAKVIVAAAYSCCPLWGSPCRSCKLTRDLRLGRVRRRRRRRAAWPRREHPQRRAGRDQARGDGPAAGAGGQAAPEGLQRKAEAAHPPVRRAPHRMDLPPNPMALITSDCDATRSPRIKWP